MTDDTPDYDDFPLQDRRKPPDRIDPAWRPLAQVHPNRNSHDYEGYAV